MRPELARCTRRGALSTAALVLAAASIAGCIVESETTHCPTGIYCPKGSSCAAQQAVCIWDECADGARQSGEACDDGNKIDGDGCSADCKSSETCGNGIEDTTAGEVCDDGNNVSGDGCGADCRSLEGCGNRIVDPDEDCDGGESGTLNVGLETESCNSNCKWVRCGDGIVNETAGEECDRNGDGQPGTNGQSAACNFNCKASRHGDGIVNSLHGEDCDDGDGSAGATCESEWCNANCTRSRCGDTIVNASAREQCDDGDTSSEDDCRNDCRSNVCGDGYVNEDGPVGHEECDLRDVQSGGRNGSSDCLYGMTSCQACSADCGTAFAGTPHYCGNGVRETDLLGVDDQYHSEACDNVYSFACGSCDRDCGQTHSPAKATGTITVTSTQVGNGDAMTLEDGTNALTLEFDTNDGCQAGRTCIVISGTLVDLATSIQAAINAGAIAIDASSSQNQVSLIHDYAGLAGNISIATYGSSVVTAPATGAIVVTGMSGGIGCARDAACAENRDCASDECRRTTHLCR